MFNLEVETAANLLTAVAIAVSVVTVIVSIIISVHSNIKQNNMFYEMNRGELQLGSYQMENLVLYLKNMGNSPVRIIEIEQIGHKIIVGDIIGFDDKSVLFEDLKDTKLFANEKFQYPILEESKYKIQIVNKEVNTFTLRVKYSDFKGKIIEENLSTKLARGERIAGPVQTSINGQQTEKTALKDINTTLHKILMRLDKM